MRGTLHVGDHVRFGSYLSQSLFWRVIDVDEKGQALLFSEDVIKMIGFDYGKPSHRLRGPFRSTMGSSMWSDSFLRSWLNSEDEEHDSVIEEPGFLHDSNFEAYEKQLIVPYRHRVVLSEFDLDYAEGGSELHEVDYEDWNKLESSMTNYDKAYYHTVTDRVFCLSVKQLIEFVCNRQDVLGEDFVLAKPTFFAIFMSPRCKAKGNTHEDFVPYWLNSPIPIDNACEVRCVDSRRFLNEAVAEAYDVGVRPALALKWSPEMTGVELVGDGSYKYPHAFSVEG